MLPNANGLAASGAASAVKWVLMSLAGCGCADSIPTKETLVTTHVAIPGKWELGASPSGVVLRTTLISDNQLLSQEESDFRQFFRRATTFAATRGRVATAWDGLGGTDAFVLSASEGEGYGVVGYWPKRDGVPILNCTQGPAILFTGSAGVPIIYVVGYGCDLACLNAGRDVAWFIGDAQSHTFTKHCATATGRLQTALRSSSSFVLWDGPGAGRRLQVEAYLDGGFESVGERVTPDGITDVYGIFEDGAILGVTSFGENSRLVEFGLEGEATPSRFGSMTGVFLQAVHIGPDGSTYAFGSDSARRTVIKRSEREKEWVRFVDLGTRAAVEMAVGPQGPVVVSLAAVDAGVYDVYIQRFEP